MSSTTAQAMIQQLRKIFATHGLPQMIVSDNDPQFVSDEFHKFCSSRGIQHNTIAPYHPRSNGEAERLVETFKRSIDKANPKTASQLQDTVIARLSDDVSVNSTYSYQQLTIWAIEQQTFTNSSWFVTSMSNWYCQKQRATEVNLRQPYQFAVGNAVQHEISVKDHIGIMPLLLNVLAM